MRPRLGWRSDTGLSPALALADVDRFAHQAQCTNAPDTPLGRMSNERHLRVKISPATPAPRVAPPHTHKTPAQKPNYINSWNRTAKPFTWTATAGGALAKVRLVATNVKKLVNNNSNQHGQDHETLHPQGETFEFLINKP